MASGTSRSRCSNNVARNPYLSIPWIRFPLWASFPDRLSHWQQQAYTLHVGSKCPRIVCPWNGLAWCLAPVGERNALLGQEWVVGLALWERGWSC